MANSSQTYQLPPNSSLIHRRLNRCPGKGSAEKSRRNPSFAAGGEVDIVLENSSGDIVGIEVKAGSTVRGDDLRGLSALKEAAKSRFKRGIVFYSGQETVPFAENIHAVPLSALWQWSQP